MRKAFAEPTTALQQGDQQAGAAILAANQSGAAAVAAAITGALANAKVGVETRPALNVGSQNVRTM
jgi:hypothetical protein